MYVCMYVCVYVCMNVCTYIQKCLAEMIARDTPGYAIGGLAGGESKEAFWKVVAQVCMYVGR